MEFVGRDANVNTVFPTPASTYWVSQDSWDDFGIYRGSLTVPVAPQQTRFLCTVPILELWRFHKPVPGGSIPLLEYPIVVLVEVQ